MCFWSDKKRVHLQELNKRVILEYVSVWKSESAYNRSLADTSATPLSQFYLDPNACFLTVWITHSQMDRDMLKQSVSSPQRYHAIECGISPLELTAGRTEKSCEAALHDNNKSFTIHIYNCLPGIRIKLLFQILSLLCAYYFTSLYSLEIE